MKRKGWRKVRRRGRSVARRRRARARGRLRVRRARIAGAYALCIRVVHLPRRVSRRAAGARAFHRCDDEKMMTRVYVPDLGLRTPERPLYDHTRASSHLSIHIPKERKSNKKRTSADHRSVQRTQR